MLGYFESNHTDSQARVIALTEPQGRRCSPRGTNFRWNRGGVLKSGSFSLKICNMSETGQDKTKIVINHWEIACMLSIGTAVNDLG